jgi:hypothetical protein
VVIEQTSAGLKHWVNETLGAELATFRSPLADDHNPQARGVALSLLDITATPPPRSARRQRLEADVRYLITAWAADALDAHRLLGDLLFAALENPDLDVGLEPPPLALWRAFGVPPQPAFVVRCRTWKDLEPRPITPVTKRVFDVGVARHIAALVIARDGRPASNVTVDLPAHGTAVQTDANGRFTFAAVLPETPSALVVRVGGVEQTVELGPATVDGPLIVHLDTQE